MRAETIQQYKALKWIEERFEVECLEVRFLDEATVEIADKNGEKAKVHCTDYGSICFIPDSAQIY